MVTVEFWQVVDYLLNKAKDSIEVNAVDDTDKTALHHAARRRFGGKVGNERLTGGILFFGWQFWERKNWSHTSQRYVYMYINMMAIAGDFKPFCVSLNFLARVI